MMGFILADLRRLRLGSALIVALVALAVALGVAVTLQERALRLGSARASDKFDLVIGAPGSETQLVLSTVFLQPAALPLVSGDVLAALQADPRVAWAAPVGFGDFADGHPVVGTTTVLLENTAPGLAQGRMFQSGFEAVLGAAVDLPLGAEITPTHGQLHQGGHAHEDVHYHVTGRLLPTGTSWDRAILVPISSVWSVHGMGEEHHDHDHDHDHAGAPLVERWKPGQAPGLPAILVKPNSIADAYRLRQDYRAEGRTLAIFPGEVLTGLYGLLGDARRVLGVVSAGALALVAAALVMVTVIHIGQRRRQIGALRAFGAPGPAIFGVVWTELFLLFGTGIVLGFAAGYLASLLMSRAISRAQGFVLPVGFAPQDLAMFLVLLVFSALAAAVPAWLAYRQPPAAALRG